MQTSTVPNKEEGLKIFQYFDVNSAVNFFVFVTWHVSVKARENPKKTVPGHFGPKPFRPGTPQNQNRNMSIAPVPSPEHSVSPPIDQQLPIMQPEVLATDSNDVLF